MQPVSKARKYRSAAQANKIKAFHDIYIHFYSTSQKKAIQKQSRLNPGWRDGFKMFIQNACRIPAETTLRPTFGNLFILRNLQSFFKEPTQEYSPPSHEPQKKC